MTDSRGAFAGKVCAVTGGGRGIGATIAESLAAAGGDVAILDLDAATANEVASRCESEGSRARGYSVDVGNENGVRTVAEQIADDLGTVDVLVNNAGIISKIGPSMDLELDEWQDAMSVMATGVFLCSREFGRQMRSGNGGSIVNISSINGLVAFPMRLVYSAAKAAVISMTEVLAVEWASYGIRVNAVAPGCTRTAMLDQAVHDRAIDSNAYLNHVPLRRWGETEEIADAVMFFASDRAAFVTGQVIAVDGGWTTFGWIPWTGDPNNPELSPPDR